ncbi:MAG: GDSL-type esterase/lipase family protein [Bifidobacterium dentium]|nr:GDSL-type esterase/lipase family protein [Bifidobacterium dentium]
MPSSRNGVFYDRRMGWMLYGEQPIDGAWYLLDANTGAVRYGWQWVGGKHVCYDWPSGKMLYGWHSVNGANYYFNTVTGALDTRRSAAIPQDTVQASAGGFGARIRQGKYHSVRILGDSIAAGVGSDETYPYTSRELFRLEGTTYYEPSSQSRMAVNDLRHYLESRGMSVTNASAPGKGSYSAYNSIGDDTLGHEDAAIVMLGANDRLRLSNVNDFTAAAESYLNRVAARYGSQNVYVIANIDTLSDPRSLTMKQENTALRKICRRHGWQHASLYSAFQTVGRTTGMPQQALYTDGIHPNRMGQEVMWRAMRQLLGL